MPTTKAESIARVGEQGSEQVLGVEVERDTELAR